MINFAVLIPAYNEEKSISFLVNGALKFTSNVIVVNDASSDKTQEVVERTSAILINHATNQGKASALKTGFQRALSLGIDCVVTLDGDGQHNPNEIESLVRAYIENPNAMIIASRVLARENAPSKRRKANDIADFWISWAASTPIVDSQSGFRLYPVSLLAKLNKTYSKARGFVFESEVIIQASQMGFNFVFVPIESCYPENSRASHFRPVYDIVKITLMVAKSLILRLMNIPGLIQSKQKQPKFYNSAQDLS